MKNKKMINNSSNDNNCVGKNDSSSEVQNSSGQRQLSPAKKIATDVSRLPKPIEGFKTQTTPKPVEIVKPVEFKKSVVPIRTQTEIPENLRDVHTLTYNFPVENPLRVKKIEISVECELERVRLVGSNWGEKEIKTYDLALEIPVPDVATLFKNTTQPIDAVFRVENNILIIEPIEPSSSRFGIRVHLNASNFVTQENGVDNNPVKDALIKDKILSESGQYFTDPNEFLKVVGRDSGDGDIIAAISKNNDGRLVFLVRKSGISRVEEHAFSDDD